MAVIREGEKKPRFFCKKKKCVYRTKTGGKEFCMLPYCFYGKCIKVKEDEQ